VTGPKLGAIVNRLRTERHWMLEDLTRFSGMNAAYLGVLERGLNMPTLATILQLAQLPQFAGSRADFEASMRRKWLMTGGRLPEKGV
jgi:transcriptional regulator with XRE-family HTH domain